jgi:nucleotide-binding universal stress UspA family protein
MPETIILSLDGSGDSETRRERGDRAVTHALDRAQRTGGTVRALFVVDTSRYGEPALSSGELLIDGIEDEGHSRLAEAAERGRRQGISVTTRCRHGRPAEELPACAVEVDAETVVHGGRRLPGRVRTELERVADTVVSPGLPAGR